MKKLLNIFVGFDQKESVAYHAFVQSLVENSSIPLSITPLADNNLNMYKEKHSDGTNKFTYSRFLIPYLMNYEGWAIFVDGDMICLSDIKKLWNLSDNRYAVQVVKHNYKTKFNTKYFGQKNEDYPRKNWSSVILWNCGHKKNKVLNPKFIGNKDGAYLHRFSWLEDEDVGDLDKTWNWLAIEYNNIKNANLIHYTLGTPCFKEYSESSMSNYWYKYFSSMLDGYYKKIIK